MPHQKLSSSIQKKPSFSIETRVYASAIDAIDVIRDATTSARDRGYSSVGNSRNTSIKVGVSTMDSPSVEKGTVAVLPRTVIAASLMQSAARSEQDDHDTIVEIHEDEGKETAPEPMTGGTVGIQFDHDDTDDPHDDHILVPGATKSLGRCTRLYHLIKRNPQRSIALLIFVVGILVMFVYIDAIVEQRACFFLKPPYKNYKITATNGDACTNFLPLDTYYTPLDPSFINRHPNTIYNVVLFGDSMVAYACLSHNLTGKIISFLPQYATNLRFFNKGIPEISPYTHSITYCSFLTLLPTYFSSNPPSLYCINHSGIPDDSISEQRERLESTIISIYQEVQSIVYTLPQP